MLGNLGLLPRFTGLGGIVAEHCICAWREGPAGHGAAVALTSEPALYDPAAQAWQNCGRYWLGMNRGQAPGPDDLVRMVGIDGYCITLLDGNEWRIPLLRRWSRENDAFESNLPKCMRRCVNDAGQAVVGMAIAAEHEALDRVGAVILEAFIRETPWSESSLFEMAAALLSENYRIGADEISLLGLLDKNLALKILALAIDEPALLRYATAQAEVGVWMKPEIEPEEDEEPPAQAVGVSDPDEMGAE